MKKKLSKARIKRLHALMSVPMTRFNCGHFCAGSNNGVPLCCDQETVVPLLFKDEFKYLKKKGRLWKKMPVISKADKDLVEDLCDYSVFCLCTGAENCRRSLRSLACRAFPFEPFVSPSGKVQGIVFQHEDRKKCPLIGMSIETFNPAYIRNSILFWQELIDAVPEERELYIETSRKLLKKAKRKGKRLKIFRFPPSSNMEPGLSLRKNARRRPFPFIKRFDRF